MEVFSANFVGWMQSLMKAVKMIQQQKNNANHQCGECTINTTNMNTTQRGVVFNLN
jgi:hypothetical protein